MNHQESQEQQALFEWAAYHPELELMHHIPNGGKRNPREAARLKREGVKAGIPDIFLPVPRRGWHGLYIEMKTPGGRLSKAQKDIHQKLSEQNYAVVVCHGCDEAIQAIQHYYE